jgi:glutathione S-transferase
MHKMLTLYYSPGACSFAVHLMLLEKHLQFTLKKVSLLTHTTEDGVSLATINPKNYVPVLVLDNGKVLTEVVVILSYVEDANYKDLELLCFISSELHKTFGAFFNKKTPEEYKVIAREKLSLRLDYIETILSNNKYLIGDTFCAADAYLFTILRWLKFVDSGLAIESWPAINNYYNVLTQRPTIQTALEVEHIPA